MPAKKTTKPADPSAPVPAAKKTAKKAAATKTAAKKAAPKKTAAKKPAAEAPSKPSPDVIARAAYLNYRRRVEQGLPGNSQGDWLEAESQFSRVSKS